MGSDIIVLFSLTKIDYVSVPELVDFFPLVAVGYE